MFCPRATPPASPSSRTTARAISRTAGSFPCRRSRLIPAAATSKGDIVNPEHVNAADLNNDGKPDLVLSLYDHNIDVFINNGDGTFQPAVPYTTETASSVGGYPRGLAFGDFNGDGKIDIATLNFGQPIPADQGKSGAWLSGNLSARKWGWHVPVAPIQYTPFNLPGGVAVGDFNGDGLPDLAVSQNYDGHSVAVMLNQPNTANQAPTVAGVQPSHERPDSRRHSRDHAQAQTSPARHTSISGRVLSNCFVHRQLEHVDHGHSAPPKPRPERSTSRCTTPGASAPSRSR